MSRGVEEELRTVRGRDRKRTMRVLTLIFSAGALLAVVMGVAGVVALQMSVASKTTLVDVYEQLAHEVERVQVASERRARKLRTAMVLGSPAELESHAAAREDFRRRLEAVGSAARAEALAEQVRVVADVERQLTAAEDQLLEVISTGSGLEQRVELFAREVQPPREDLDDAVNALLSRVHAQVWDARRASDRTDALGLAGLVASLVFALAAIAALAVALRSTLRRLAEVQRRLDEAMTFQQRLMGIVGHDIRSPVSAILLGATRLSKQPGDAEGFERYRESIVRNAGRVERIAGLLMDVTRFEAGLELPIQRRTADFHRTVAQLVDEARAANPGRAIAFHCEGDGWASFDEDRMAQVVNNVLNNALRHSPPGSAVEVQSRSSDDVLELTVHNPGRIDERIVERVFEPFTKGSPTADRFSAGLGLYVAKKLIEAHGGSISIGPSGDGTTVRLRLPRGLGKAEARGAGEGAPAVH